MRTTDPAKLPPGRYTQGHLEILQKTYLYAQLCQLADMPVVSLTWLRIKDTDIEPMTRIRRNCIVDLLRDGYLDPPDAIIPRGDKLYVITDRCLEAVEAPEMSIQDGVLDLGGVWDRDRGLAMKVSELVMFTQAVADGIASIVWDTGEFGSFAQVLIKLTPDEIESPFDERESSENFFSDESPIGVEE